MRRSILISLLLVAATWTVFAQVCKFEFVDFDDRLYVFKNSHVQGGLTWENMQWAFSVEAVPVTANWHPLTWLSLMLDTELFGTEAGGYHVTSLLLHTANVLLLFAVLQRMTGEAWKSACVAVLFAVHPLHVESVAWISERKDVLSTFFGFLCLTAYARYAGHAGRRAALWYVAALAAFVLSLLAKQMLVTLPFLLLLLDFWPLGRVQREGAAPSVVETDGASIAAVRTVRPARTWLWLLWEKLPFFLVTILFCVVAMLGQEKGEAVVPMDQFSLADRCRNALVVTLIYIAKTVWPHNLACLYLHPDSIPLMQWIGAAVVLLLATAAVLQQLRRRPYLSVGWFWYLGTLVPVIGLVQIGSQRMADRYTYVPLIGLFMAVCWCVPTLLPRSMQRRAVLPVLTAVVIVLLAVAGWKQTGYWRNSVLLFEHALAVDEANDLMHTNLGTIWHGQGQLDRAIYHYRRAAQVEPLNVLAQFNLGLLLSEQGDMEGALRHYQMAVMFDSQHFDALNNLGNLLSQQGEFAEAEHCSRRAIQLEPTSAMARCNLGYALLGQRRFDEAQIEFEFAAQIDPEYRVTGEELADYHLGIGESLAAEGEFSPAIAHFRQAQRWEPGNLAAQYDLALALLSIGQWDEAREWYTRLLVSRPDFAEGHNELGEVLLQQGERGLAIEHFREAIRLEPDLAAAHDNLQRALTE